MENWFGRFAADCVGCTETLVAVPICEVTATEERHRLREIPLDAASEERRALLDQIKEWVDRARQAGNTQEATMREEATALLPLLEKCFGGGTNFFALIRLRRRAKDNSDTLRLASGAALSPES